MKYLLFLLVSVHAFAAEKVVNFDQWSDGPERRVMNLFPGFESHGDGGPSVIYLKTEKASVPHPADTLDLGRAVDLQAIGQILSSFANVTEIPRANLEIAKLPKLAYRIDPARAWCEQGLCIDLDFKVDAMTKLIIAIKFRKGSAINAQSELRSYRGNELTAGEVEDLQKLFGVSTQPTSVLVQNIFWFRHVVEFAKVVAVVQPDPKNPNSSIVSGAVLFAVEKKWWNFGYKGMNLSEVFLGHHLNSSKGIAMGFPRMTDQIFSELVKRLESGN